MLFIVCRKFNTSGGFLKKSLDRIVDFDSTACISSIHSLRCVILPDSYMRLSSSRCGIIRYKDARDITRSEIMAENEYVPNTENAYGSDMNSSFASATANLA